MSNSRTNSKSESNRNKLNVRTPGEAPPDPKTLPPQEPKVEAPQLQEPQVPKVEAPEPKVAASEQPAPQAPPPQPQEDVAAAAESKADQEALFNAEVARRVKARMCALNVKPGPDDHLPAQSEIDQDTITRAVLTRDGYLCPKDSRFLRRDGFA